MVDEQTKYWHEMGIKAIPSIFLFSRTKTTYPHCTGLEPGPVQVTELTQKKYQGGSNSSYSYLTSFRVCTSQLTLECHPTYIGMPPILHWGVFRLTQECLPTYTGVLPNLHWGASQLKQGCLSSYRGVPPN